MSLSDDDESDAWGELFATLTGVLDFACDGTFFLLWGEGRLNDACLHVLRDQWAPVRYLTNLSCVELSTDLGPREAPLVL